MAPDYNTHQTITYRSFKDFDESSFISDMHGVPWETVEYFNDINKSLKFGIKCS